METADTKHQEHSRDNGISQVNAQKNTNQGANAGYQCEAYGKGETQARGEETECLVDAEIMLLLKENPASGHIDGDQAENHADNIHDKIKCA